MHRLCRSVPVFEGIVVCTEFKDAILEAYYEEEERREVVEERRRNEAQALSRWYQLLSSLVTRQRLKNCYGNGALPASTNILVEVEITRNLQVATKITSCLLHNFVPTEDHEHVFLVDDETLTKRLQYGQNDVDVGFQ